MNNFYYPELSENIEKLELIGDEARHVSGSKRLRQDDKLTVFNGRGLLAHGYIESIAKQSVKVIINKIERLIPPRNRLVLATALPKGDRVSTLLDMATQLGMTDFVPLHCERSVIINIDNKIDRYNRICVHACKQSGQYFLPNIHLSVTPAQLLDQFDQKYSQFILADTEAESSNFKFNQDVKTLVLIVGPEGGFTTNERVLFYQHKVDAINLSNSILRIETACVAFLAKISHRQIV